MFWCSILPGTGVFLCFVCGEKGRTQGLRDLRVVYLDQIGGPFYPFLHWRISSECRSGVLKWNYKMKWTNKEMESKAGAPPPPQRRRRRRREREIVTISLMDPTRVFYSPFWISRTEFDLPRDLCEISLCEICGYQSTRFFPTFFALFNIPKRLPGYYTMCQNATFSL